MTPSRTCRRHLWSALAASVMGLALAPPALADRDDNKVRVCDAAGDCRKVKARELAQAPLVEKQGPADEVLLRQKGRGKCKQVRHEKRWVWDLGPWEPDAFTMTLVKTFCWKQRRHKITYAPAARLEIHDGAASHDREGRVEEYYPYDGSKVKSGHHSWRAAKFKVCGGICFGLGTKTIAIRVHYDGTVSRW